LILSNSLILQGATIMEISRNGSVLINDQIQVAGKITYGGSLTVNEHRPLPRWRQAIVSSCSALETMRARFSSISLPSLGFNLSWTNKLAVDGSMEVVGGRSHHSRASASRERTLS